MERFDAIVFGDGPAGYAAALAIRGSGKQVLVLRPAGEAPSEEALGSGFVYRTSRDPALPLGLLEPVGERYLSEIRWVMLEPGGSTTIDCRDPSWERPVPIAYATTRLELRAKLSTAAEKAGVEIRQDTADASRVASSPGSEGGDTFGGSAFQAPVTVRTMFGSGGPIARPNAGREVDRVAEQSFHLTSAQWESRLSLRPSQGVAFEILPVATGPLVRGFLITRQDQVSLGAILHAPSQVSSDALLRSILGEIRGHPSIAPLLRDAQSDGVNCYSLPNGTATPPAAYGPGFLRAGAALGTPCFDGIRPLRLDLEVRSGWVAGTAIAQMDGGSLGTRNLGRNYTALLRSSGLVEEAARMRAILRDVSWNPKLIRRYPILFSRLLHELMHESGAPKRSVRSTILKVQKATQVGRISMALDGLRTGGVL